MISYYEKFEPSSQNAKSAKIRSGGDQAFQLLREAGSASQQAHEYATSSGSESQAAAGGGFDQITGDGQ